MDQYDKAYAEGIKSQRLINSWNNKKRICGCCNKNRLTTRMEFEKNCCLTCGVNNLIDSKDNEIERLKGLLKVHSKFGGSII